LLWFILFGVLAILLVSGSYLFVLACVRRKDMPWLVEKELNKTPLGRYYSYIAESDHWLTEHSAKDVYIYSEDHLKLHGLWVPAENPRGTVLFAHGYRSTILLDFGAAFSLYHQRGLNLLIPDQRAHGKSEGRYITFGVKESGDMVRWINYHNQNYGTQPILLSGISMGASTMMFLADQDLPENVRCIIADCGFTSPKEIISEVFRRVIHLPPAPSVWVGDKLARIFANFSFGEKDARRSLARSRLPILMIHGKEDGFVPCEMSENSYSLCAEPKELLLVEGADHGLSFIKEPARYVDAVDRFLEKYLYRR